MKLTIGAIAVACTGLFSSEAMADQLSSPRGFYVAGDFDQAYASGHSFNGGDIALGWRSNRHVGFEAGVLDANVQGATVTSEYVEMQGFLPLWRNASLMASLGGSLASVTVSSGSFFAGTSGTGYRAGIGFEERLSDHWTFRTSAHYQTALTNVSIFSVGVGYGF